MLPGRFVETQYKLEIGAAQNTQLSKAIASGAEKKVFSLPKGTFILFFHLHLPMLTELLLGASGRVKLAPKVKADVSSKEVSVFFGLIVVVY